MKWEGVRWEGGSMKVGGCGGVMKCRYEEFERNIGVRSGNV